MLHDAEHAAAHRAVVDAHHHIKAERREARIVKGQIRIEVRRTSLDAATAAEKVTAAPNGKIIKGEKRNHVVRALAETLNASKLSPFEFEASSRHGVRCELCLDGVSWPVADREAAALVAEGLDRIHARRPSYEEGQREYSIPPDYCAWCGSPLEDEAHRGSHMSFCDELCATAAIKHRELQRVRKETRAYIQAYNVIYKSRHPQQNCEECGKAYRPWRIGQQFCTKACSSQANGRRCRTLQDRDCKTCGTLFRPRDSSQTYCGVECADKAKRTLLWRVPRECVHCKKSFMPHTEKQRLCSQACNAATRVTHTLACQWCGCSFEAKQTSATACSVTCYQAARRHRLGQTHQFTLSWHVFDHFVSMPAIAAATAQNPVSFKKAWDTSGGAYA